jgi:small conductance mechanosensitive channel
MKMLESVFGINYADVNQFLLKIGTQIAIAIVIFVVGFWLTGLITKGVKRIMVKSETDPGLTSFLISFISLSSKILVTITAFTQLGIQMTSFITILGAAGLAIGMAFSGTLSNFAGGVMILVLKPFKVGDEIIADSAQGIVTEIQIFNTYLLTMDNKVEILPNGPVANGLITNFTKQDKRRVDLTFILEHDTDVKRVAVLLKEVASKEKRILKDPEPYFGISKIAENGIHYSMHVWVKTLHYNDIHFDINLEVFEVFKSNQIAFSKGEYGA